MAAERRFRTLGLVDEWSQIMATRAAVPVVLLLVWQVLAMAFGRTIIPGPVFTLNEIIGGMQDGWLARGLVATMESTAVAFAFAVVTGLTAGTVVGSRDVVYELLEPFILSFYSIPKISLYPIFLALFGVAEVTKMAFGTFQGFFPMLIITMGAIREVDEVYWNVARSLRLDRFRTFRYVVFPSILVQLVVALRLTFNLAFLGVILSELFAAKAGLGLILQHALGTFNASRIMVIVVMLSLVAFVANVVFYVAQQRLEDRWNMSARDVEM